MQEDLFKSGTGRRMGCERTSSSVAQGGGWDARGPFQEWHREEGGMQEDLFKSGTERRVGCKRTSSRVAQGERTSSRVAQGEGWDAREPLQEWHSLVQPRQHAEQVTTKMDEEMEMFFPLFLLILGRWLNIPTVLLHTSKSATYIVHQGVTGLIHYMVPPTLLHHIGLFS